METMNKGEKYVEKTTRRKTTISPMEEYEAARSCQKKHPTKRQKREDLLTYYLRMQDAKKSCPSGNKQSDIFTLPCSDSLRRDIEVLQRFIKMHGPSGDVVHEEVVIATEETEVTKAKLAKRNNLTEAESQVQEGSGQSVSICSPRPSIRVAD